MLMNELQTNVIVTLTLHVLYPINRYGTELVTLHKFYMTLTAVSKVVPSFCQDPGQVVCQISSSQVHPLYGVRESIAWGCQIHNLYNVSLS